MFEKKIVFADFSLFGINNAPNITWRKIVQQ